MTILFHHVFLKHSQKYRAKQKAINQAIKLFRQNPTSPQLKTHKLSGQLENYWSFSVDYHTRIIFRYVAKNAALFLDIGTHEVYR